MMASLLVSDRKIQYFSPGIWETYLPSKETQPTSDFSTMLAAIRWRREVFEYSHFGLIVNSHRRYGNLVDKSPCRASTDGCGIGSNLVRGELAAFS
jgi:hypothetical protein